ncbi:MAG: phage holin family protein [Firmicutes bacterium]|nr:phage holin family protein [Bacillota bacterium]
MREIWSYLQMAIAAVGGWLGWFFGGYDGFLYALITFVVVDYVTGVMVAIIDKRLSSDIGARGIFKKVLIFTLVGVAHIIDSRIIGDGSAIRTAVIFFYLSNEGISIIENASRIGLPIPKKLTDVLAQFNGKAEEKKDETNRKIYDQ